MSRPAKPCNTPGCPNLQPCPTEGHTKKPWQGSTRRSRLPRGWERTRRRILARDETCQDGRCCSGNAIATQVDHIVAGDDHSDTNLQGICADCHRAKTLEEAAAARAR